MQYDEAEQLLNEAIEASDNQVQQFIAYVQQMRLCQRRSRNREFHEFRELADKTIRRIDEERQLLSEHDRRCLLYAETEYAIVNSTYYYYVGLERQSIEALERIHPNEVLRDTAQYLNYMYNIGAGGIITEGSQQEINQQEFDHLMRCFLLARHADMPFFAANALEALSEHLMEPEYRERLIEDNLPAMKFLNPDRVDDDMLAGYLAESALYLFEHYGDVSAIYQAPDLVASIREQLSVAYAAMDNKPQSDYNRNLYLDLQETTRQDRQLEARASQYEKTAVQLNIMIAAVIAAILLLLFSLWLFNHMNRKHSHENPDDNLLDLKKEELAAQLLRVESSERRNLEQRAKISLVNSITPFIDRILHEVRSPKKGDLTYVHELTDQINDYNDVLTYWIQLRQGELSLKIESFLSTSRCLLRLLWSRPIRC